MEHVKFAVIKSVDDVTSAKRKTRTSYLGRDDVGFGDLRVAAENLYAVFFTNQCCLCVLFLPIRYEYGYAFHLGFCIVRLDNTLLQSFPIGTYK